MPQLAAVPQQGFDEQVIEDTEVEQALDERERHKASLAIVRKIYDGAHLAAIAAIEKLELPEGGVARVGRFRIAKTEIPARSVTFDTKASSRVRISVVDDD